MARNPSAAQRQLDLMAETNDPREVVRQVSRRGADNRSAADLAATTGFRLAAMRAIANLVFSRRGYRRNNAGCGTRHRARGAHVL